MDLMPDIEVTGTDLSFADLYIDISTLDETYEYESLARVPLTSPLMSSAIEAFEDLLAAFIAGETEKDASVVKVTLVRQEEVTDSTG